MAKAKKSTPAASTEATPTSAPVEKQAVGFKGTSPKAVAAKPEAIAEKAVAKKATTAKAPKTTVKASMAAKPATPPAKPAKSLLAIGGIDTNLVAQVAARSVSHRVGMSVSGIAGSPGVSSPTLPPSIPGESSSFKNLKLTLNQPTSTLDKILGPSGQKKDGGSFLNGGASGGRGQSTGAGDAKNVGVPRRTNG